MLRPIVSVWTGSSSRSPSVRGRSSAVASVDVGSYVGRGEPTLLATVSRSVPLVIASGAGSSARRSLGTAAFGGMLAATTLTILFVPMFSVVIQRLAEGERF